MSRFHGLAADECFAAAAELPAHARRAFVEREAHGDPALQAEVLSLLAHHESSQDFLSTPAVLEAIEADAPASTAVVEDGPLSGVGRSIGSYTIEEVIGEGGMGVVYLARQDHPKRSVALKVIRPGFVTPRLLLRFEREAQILGRLNHPGIGQIFEAGSARIGSVNVPFLAMELVRGPSITAHAEREHLELRARLELFAEVCDAIEHAHRQGVVHRDLKPANILVDTSTARALPKVLDFGIARDVDEGGASPLTGTGQIVGTLAYMSPEQAGGPRERVDARSDVYALGVILYELITARLPHDVGGLSLPEAAKSIIEAEPAPPSRFDPRLAGDIDTIVAKALAKDPGRRYASAAELAHDVRRSLADQPIQARPPSSLYRLEKFARRNRALVGGVVSVFFVLAAGTVVSSLMAVRANDQRDRAVEAEGREKARGTELAAALSRETDARTRIEREKRHSDSVSEYFQGLIAEVVPGERGPDALLVDLLEQAVAELPGALVSAPDVEIEVRAVLGQSLGRLGRLEEGERQLRAALELAENTESTPPLQVAELQGYLGQALLRRDKMVEAEALLTRAFEHASEAGGENNARLLGSMIDLGTLHRRQGRAREARAVLDLALKLARECPDGGGEALYRVLCQLGLFTFEAGNLEDAERFQREALELALGEHDESHPNVLRTTSELACTLQLRDQLEESQRLHERAVELGERIEGERHPNQLARMSNLASVLTARREFHRAMAIRRRVVELTTEVLGAEHQDTWITRENLALLLAKGGTVDEAESILRDVLARERERFGDSDRRTLETMSNLCWLLREEEKYEEALVLYDELVDTSRIALPDDDWKPQSFLASRGICRMRTGQFATAEQDLLAAHEGLTRLLGSASSHTQSARRNLVKLYEAWGRPEAADPWR